MLNELEALAQGGDFLLITDVSYVTKDETPVPIPNTEVNPLSVDGTARATVWESRTLPGVKIKTPLTSGVLIWVDGSQFRVHGYLSILVWLHHELLPY